MIKLLIKTIIDFIYPPKCIFCNDILKIGSKDLICEKCIYDFPILDNMFFIDKNNGNTGFSIVKYNDIISQSIHRFKYNDNPEYAKIYAEIIFKYIIKYNFLSKIDCLTSVPIHHKKQKKRGFNQAELIALHFSQLTNIPYKTLLIRTRNTLPQSQIEFNKRYENLNNAFKIKEGENIKNKKILIIDDIYTSGSTIKHCRDILEQNGAEVLFLTFVRAKTI